jgi:DNA polymerase/3'-5' exonuclease PolX
MPDTTQIGLIRKACEDKAIVKHDAGKSPVFRGVIQYFPEALKAVADVSEMGARKYSWDGWKESASFKDIPRFEDALARHLVNEITEGYYDPESRLLHAAHAAWNALAKLELLLSRFPNKLQIEQIKRCVGQDAQTTVPSAAGGDCMETVGRTAYSVRR